MISPANSTARKLLPSAVLLVSASAASAAISAGVKVMLSGASQIPPVNKSVRGSGVNTFSDDGTISSSTIIRGSDGFSAQIHAGAAAENDPYIVSLATEGNTFKVPAGTKLTPEQLQILKAGNLHVKVHSRAQLGGESRAHLKYQRQ